MIVPDNGNMDDYTYTCLLALGSSNWNTIQNNPGGSGRVVSIEVRNQVLQCFFAPTGSDTTIKCRSYNGASWSGWKMLQFA